MDLLVAHYYQNILDQSLHHKLQAHNEDTLRASWIPLATASVCVNRPICYLNAYDQQPNNNSVPEDSDIHILSSEVTVEPRFRIAYAFESQLKKISPLSIMLYDQHYVSLVSTIHNATVFDFNSICFFNSFNLLDNELFI